MLALKNVIIGVSYLLHITMLLILTLLLQPDQAEVRSTHPTRDSNFQTIA